MAIQDLILIDTCIWVQFFNRPHSREKRCVDALLDEDRVALIGPILAEILLRFRRDEQADWVASTLSSLHEIPITQRGPAATEWEQRIQDSGFRIPCGEFAHDGKL